ncbi:TMEM165/GDT1 family protein [Telmatospirillum sp. J64-1]|uniref:TMEM165/GDT1 family protein n=1 Tax=Telmatospirillum sp. J64-1 TaxID=2502183 RepID=UPI00115C74BF|nr:TMEM165/GDT1 family protein [Telmatospirillum sp. J64-1]
MEALLISTPVVAVAEIGDKTQLLALILAARFRRPVPIILGILVATLANHALAAWLGVIIASWLGGEILRWLLGLSFLAMAVWMMIPDKIEEEPRLLGNLGPFLATLVAFFFVEIGDKTQVATVALAARFDNLLLVTLGTTLGMMLANVPAVLLGEVAAKKVPLRLVHGLAAAAFAIIGAMALMGVGSGW